MKQLLPFILFLFSTYFPNLYAQEINIKEGAYKNLLEFHENKPFIEGVSFQFKDMAKENTYSIKRKNLKGTGYKGDMTVWAIYQDSILYLNLKRYGMGNGFAKILLLGRYSFFIGRVKKTAGHKKYVEDQYFKGGLLGLLLAEYAIAKGADRNNMFIIDLKKGIPDNLNIGYMKTILNQEKDLYDSYMFEKNKTSANIMLEYIDRLNNRLPLY